VASQWHRLLHLNPIADFSYRFLHPANVTPEIICTLMTLVLCERGGTGVSHQQEHLDTAAAGEQLNELHHQVQQAREAAAAYKPGSAAGKAAVPLAALLEQALAHATEAHTMRVVAERQIAAAHENHERSEARLLDVVSEQAERIRQLEREAAALREKVRQYSEAIMPAQQQIIRVSGKLPFGYTRAPDGAPVEEPEQAATVRLIFDVHENGMSLRKIADYLTEHALGTPRDDSEHWQASSVRQILKQRAIYEGKTGYPALLGKQ
jgi:hypothetical protein